MFSRVLTFAIDGLEPRPVTVEVDIRAGLPGFAVVGLGDAAVREARERVPAALINSGFDFPMRRITANLAPAHLRKIGPGFDLALAVALLAAGGQLPAARLDGLAVVGELSLDGSVRGVRGTLAVAEGARTAGLSGLILPADRVAEAQLVDGLAIFGVSALRDVDAILAGRATPAAPTARRSTRSSFEPDLADVRGQDGAVNALIVAAAGGHNLLMQGPPGSGKTMLARRLPSILPPLGRGEALEVTRIHSVAGLATGDGLLEQRPFRAPHHTISAPGLVGGGAVPSPGEVSLAHHGVLFLDELPEFTRPALEALRQPLEDGRVAIVRGQRTTVFPTRFALVAAANHCPCGYARTQASCRCTEADLLRYQRRLSGPLLDRIDLQMTVDRPSGAALAQTPRHTSASARERVLEARDRQRRRCAGTHVVSNAELDSRLAARLIDLTTGAERQLRQAYDRGTLSPRGRHRALRVARTLADLEAHERVERDDMLTALSLRPDASSVELAA